MNKEVRKFCKRLNKLGFETAVGKHISVTLNGRRVSTLGVSPSDFNWMRNTISDIRRETGIDVG
jgi:hypothetical protein